MSDVYPLQPEPIKPEPEDPAAAIEPSAAARAWADIFRLLRAALRECADRAGNYSPDDLNQLAAAATAIWRLDPCAFPPEVAHAEKYR